MRDLRYSRVDDGADYRIDNDFTEEQAQSETSSKLKLALKHLLETEVLRCGWFSVQSGWILTACLALVFTLQVVLYQIVRATQSQASAFARAWPLVDIVRTALLLAVRVFWETLKIRQMELSTWYRRARVGVLFLNACAVLQAIWLIFWVPFVPSSASLYILVALMFVAFHVAASLPQIVPVVSRTHGGMSTQDANVRFDQPQRTRRAPPVSVASLQMTQSEFAQSAMLAEVLPDTSSEQQRRLNEEFQRRRDEALSRDASQSTSHGGIEPAFGIDDSSGHQNHGSDPDEQEDQVHGENEFRVALAMSMLVDEDETDGALVTVRLLSGRTLRRYISMEARVSQLVYMCDSNFDLESRDVPENYALVTRMPRSVHTRKEMLESDKTLLDVFSNVPRVRLFMERV